jgi:hypothetical protein
MLIIAQPKSASTSLAMTMADILDWPFHQVFLSKHKSRKSLCLSNLRKKRDQIVPDLPHGDMCQYTSSDLKSMSVLHKIFKQHIPPTDNNLRNLKEKQVKCIILLRDPKEASLAYMRHVKMSEKEKYKNPRKNSIVLNKRFFALSWFHNRYLGINDLNYVKIIHFENLVVEPTRIVNEILEFYSREPVDNVVLRQERFTGVGLNKLKENKSE